jgi:hypothetical protein
LRSAHGGTAFKSWLAFSSRSRGGSDGGKEAMMRARVALIFGDYFVLLVVWMVCAWRDASQSLL